MFGRYICIEKLEISPIYQLHGTGLSRTVFPFLNLFPIFDVGGKIYLFKYIKLNISLPFVFKVCFCFVGFVCFLPTLSFYAVIILF